MPDYTAKICNSLTDEVIAELPATTIQFSEVLNAPGSAEVTTALDLATTAVAAVEPLLQSLYIFRDGVPLWGGILWATSMSVADNAMTLQAAGFWSLLRRRRIRTTTTFTDVDQALIVKGIVDDLQAVSGGDMLIDTSALTAVGVTRDRTYNDYERKNAGEAIEQLSAVRNGFDYAIRPALVSGVLTRRMTVSYPAAGRQTNIVLDAGSNVELLSATNDATTMVTTAHVKGEGDGESSMLQTLANAPLLGVYPLVEELAVFSDIKETATLDAHARHMLDVGKRPMLIPTVVTYGGVEPVVGSYVVGDQVRLRARYGLLNIDDTFRITEWVCTVAENGSESVTLNLAPLEVFSDV